MRRVRAAVALLLAGAAASYGVTGPLPAAAAAPPAGGCWSYVPSGAALTAPPTADVSTGIEDWTTGASGEVALATSGATATGGSRTITVSITSGPILSTQDDLTGTASFVLSVDGTPLAAPLTAPFATEAGEPVDGLVATASAPVGAAGAHTVRIDAVYFDVPTGPGAPLRMACNGQTQEAASPGVNPATTPQPTNVTAAWTAVGAASAAITGVADQAVQNAGRPADVATVQVAGFASAAPVTLELCSSAGACSPVASVTSGADGAATTTFMVPGNAPVGAGTLKAGDGTTTATTPFTVLGTQVVAAAEKLDVESTLVTLTGTGWDPTRPVTIRGYAGPSSSAAATGDPVVTAQVDATGAFTAEYEVADEATESVIVDQARTSTHIGAVYLISGVIGGAAAPDDGKTPTDPDESDNPGDGADGGSDAGAGSDGGVVTTPIETPAAVDPPEDIPLPGDVPVEEPDTESPADGEVEEELSVTEARLDGEATLSELFGGAPQRDLVFLVENVGEETVENPIVRVSVGRSESVEPEIVAAEVGVLDPGEQTVVTVPLSLPMAAFGTYTVVGQVGDTSLGAFELEWTTYPWGLFALNALALALLVIGVRHRLALRRKAQAAALDLPGGEAVVDLAAADAWAAYRAGTGPKPRPATHPTAHRAPAPAPSYDEPTDGAAVVDLEAAERWWSRRPGDRSEAS